MLRHAHFYMKGGKRTFAAVSIKDCNADEVAVRLRASKVRLFREAVLARLRMGSWGTGRLWIGVIS
jgi:hypothetical protein